MGGIPLGTGEDGDFPRTHCLTDDELVAAFPNRK